MPVKITVGLSFIIYAGLLGGAFFISHLCDREKAAFEKEFSRPFNIETLEKLSVAGRKNDNAFWEKIKALQHKDKNQETYFAFSDDFTPEQLSNWRKRFESSKEFAILDEAAADPLPAYTLEPAKYNLAAAVLGDLQAVRYLMRIQEWKVRFAIEKGERKALVTALKRIDNLCRHFDGKPILICALVWQAIENMRIKILEEVLASKLLTGDDLLSVKQQLRESRGKLAAQEYEALWGELLFGADFLEGAIYTDEVWSGVKILPMKKIRFFIPQIWLIHEANRLNHLRYFRNAKKFHDLSVDEVTPSFYSYFSSTLGATFYKAGNRFLQTSLALQCMEFFIDQELYRLAHGKLPEKLPLPVDPFTQKPMKYICGNVTVKREIRETPLEREFTISARCLVSPSKETPNVNVTIPDTSRFRKKLLKAK